MFEAIGRPDLQKPTKILCGPDKTPLEVLGCATVQLTYKKVSIKHYVYVIRRLSNNLLGLTALDILAKVDAILSRENPILSKIYVSMK